MNQDRDIDEVLASLDALLKEGQSHEDMTIEYVNPAKPEALAGVMGDVANHEPDEAVDEIEFANIELDSAEEVESEAEIEAEMEIEVETAEPARHRVVLTEEMLLDNPQTSLPLLDDASSDAVLELDDVADAVEQDDAEKSLDEVHAVEAEVETEASPELDFEAAENDMLLEPDFNFDDIETSHESSPSDDVVDEVSENEKQSPVHLDKHNLEALLTVVADDVSSYMQKILPKLIRISLHEHLKAMQQGSTTQKPNNNE